MLSDPACSPRRLAARAALPVALVGIGVLLLVHVDLYRFLCDDAFISFRYCRNLLNGHGLVFNPGEAVEGYTNFLWVLEVAGLWGLGLRPEVGSLALSLAFTLATAALIVRMCRVGGRSRWWVAVGALLLWSTNRSVATWSTSGLETRQFTFFVVLGIELLRSWSGRRSLLVAASLSFAAAEWTRPEGLLFFGCCGGWLLLHARQRPLRPLLTFALPFVGLVGAHFLFRWIYYGELVPNTYHAKVVRPWFEAGGRYFAVAAIEYAGFLLVPLASIGAWWRMARARDSLHVIGGFCLIPHAIYLAKVGGDHFEFRMLDVYWPLLYVAAVDGIAACAAAAGRRRPRRTTSLSTCTGGALFSVVLLYGTSLAFAYAPLQARPTAYHRHVPVRPEDAPLAAALPGMRALLPVYNEYLTYLNERYICIRHAQHRDFGTRRIAGYLPYERYHGTGFLPASAVSAIGAVGIEPFYLPDLTVIDLNGLTDATIAKAPVARGNDRRRMAHDRSPPAGYLESRGANVKIHQAVPTLRNAFHSEVNPNRFAVWLRDDLWMLLESSDHDWVERAFSGRELRRMVRLAPNVAARNRFWHRGDRYDGRKILASFERERDEGWALDGSVRVGGVGRRAQPVDGAVGWKVLDSRGEGGTGRARSPAFQPRAGDCLAFLVAGGTSSELGVDLLRDNTVVRSARGKDDGQLRIVVWPLAEWTGDDLRVIVRDDVSGRGLRGSLVVDHFLLARRPVPARAE